MINIVPKDAKFRVISHTIFGEHFSPEVVVLKRKRYWTYWETDCDVDESEPCLYYGEPYLYKYHTIFEGTLEECKRVLTHMSVNGATFDEEYDKAPTHEEIFGE